VTDLDVRINDAGTRFILLAPHAFEQEGITIPAGYRCDFASTPRAVWFWLPPLGRYQRAALLHDWLYGQHRRYGAGRRDLADRAFLRQMHRDGVGWRTRWPMYLAVRIFGAAYWK
jgi:hypothetical protein